jgi:hypothetical protein
VRQAISVFKNAAAHERTLRRFEIGPGGLRVGPVLKDFHGVLTGVPTYHGAAPADWQISHGSAHPDLRAHRTGRAAGRAVLALAAIDSHVCATLAELGQELERAPAPC